jgi:LysM repeat protein
MNLAALLSFAPLVLGLFWAAWLLFKKDILAKGPMQVITYFVGVILSLWIIGWMVDWFLPHWMAQRLLNARQSSSIQAVQQISREIVNEAMGEISVPTVIVYTPVSPPPVPAATPAPSIPLVPQAPPVTPASPQSAPAQGMVPALPAQSAGEQVYIVRPGDTLYSISRRFGVSVQAIQQRNGLADPNIIRVGQQLIIPSP